MIVMLALGGYLWTVIPLYRRDDYMDTLESGSVEPNIDLFASFLGCFVSDCLQCRLVQ